MAAAIVTYLSSFSWILSMVFAAVALPIACIGWQTIVSNSSAPARGRGASAGALGGVLLFIGLLVTAFLLHNSKKEWTPDESTAFGAMICVGVPIMFGIGGRIGIVLAILVPRKPS